jgi:hypothetical protein
MRDPGEIRGTDAGAAAIESAIAGLLKSRQTQTQRSVAKPNQLKLRRSSSTRLTLVEWLKVSGRGQWVPARVG